MKTFGATETLPLSHQEEVYQPFTEDDDNEWEDATDEDATAR